MLAYLHEQPIVRSVRGLSRHRHSRGQALKAATALSKRDDEVSSIKGELLVIKWMMGFVLAFQVAIFAKLFMH
jgi:hypothetical protein